MGLLSTSAFADDTAVTDVRLAHVPGPGAADAGRSGAAAAPRADAEWTAIADLPTGAQDTAAAWVDGRSYVLGGYSASQLHATAAGYAFDTASGKWTSIADLPAALMQARAAVVGGKIYVFGGWTDTDTVDTVYVYDPGADAWSKASAMPEPRAASGIAVVDGAVYIVGGCTSADPAVCTPGTNVWRYDTSADSWHKLGDYPVPFAHGACGGPGGGVVCAGGITDDNGKSLASTYILNGDAWKAGADLPRPLWAMASTVADGNLIVSNGIVNGSSVTNETLGFDPAAGQWTPLPAAGQLAYRGSMSCGLVKAGGRNGLTVATAETLPGYTDCGS